MEDRAHIRVLNAVRRALVESPDLGNRQLYDFAVDRYAWVTELSPQQFYARFVRRARREVGVKPPRGRSATAKQAAGSAPKPPTPEESKRGQEERGSTRPEARRTAKPQRHPRREVRELFVAFAQDVAGAESDLDIVEAIRRVDDYADRVLQAYGSR